VPGMDLSGVLSSPRPSDPPLQQTSSERPGSRLSIDTREPERAQCRAMARPSPVDAPVISTCLLRSTTLRRKKSGHSRESAANDATPTNTHDVASRDTTAARAELRGHE